MEKVKLPSPAPDALQAKDFAVVAGLYKLDPTACNTELSFAEWIGQVITVLGKRKSVIQIINYNWWALDANIPITPEKSLGIPMSEK